MQISVHSVIVKNRFRKDIGDIEKLKRSLSDIGLLQPIGIDKDRRLVFGGRRLEAARQLGWAVIESKVVDCDALIAEHDENEMREAFRVTERVAIAEAVAVKMKKDAEARMKAGSAPLGNISPGSDQGRTSDLAAAKAGLGSGKTLEAAQAVIEKGAPELVQAMDDNKVTIHAAKFIATLPEGEQAGIDYDDRQKVKNAAEKARGRANRVAEPKPMAEKPAHAPKPDEARLYEEGSSLSALVLSHRAQTAICQISKNDPQAMAAIGYIREALDKQLHLITKN
jgi:ParB-like chromosome segregation protein Spo0J